MFTIKIQPKDRPFDVIATAADQYKKGMTDHGFNLWYTPYGKPEVWCGVGLLEGDVAYIENAAGKTIDKVEGFESRIAPPPEMPFPGSTMSVEMQRAQGVNVPISRGSPTLPSAFALGDTAYLADGTQVTISGVLFSEGKVHYHLEGSVKAWDSCDIFAGAPVGHTSDSVLFTQRHEVTQ